MNVRVKESEIHGLGVFANEFIFPGQSSFVHGELTEDCSSHVFHWDEKLSYAPYAPWKYLNHSDTPNCEVTTYSEDPAMLWIEAILPILTNEELTINYEAD